MTVHGCYGGCDPCRTDWKSKINDLWERYQEVVKSVQINDVRRYPDGSGNVTIPGLVSDLLLTDMQTYYNLTIDTDIANVGLSATPTYWNLTIGV